MARWLVVEGQPIPVTGPPGVGLKWRGTWDENVPYIAQDIVHFQGDTYIAVVASLGVPPLSDDATPVPTEEWNIFLQGGTGSGAVVDEDSIFLRSPDETIWKITVGDDGVLTTEEVTD